MGSASFYYGETINILSTDMEFEFGLNENGRLTIAMINFNGYKFWHYLKKSNYSFGDKYDQRIDEIAFICERKEKLKSIKIDN